MSLYTPGEIIDGYKMHAQNLYYLITNFEATRLVKYLEEYLAWFLALAIGLIIGYYLLFWFLKEGTRY